MSVFSSIGDPHGRFVYDGGCGPLPPVRAVIYGYDPVQEPARDVSGQRAGETRRSLSIEAGWPPVPHG